MKTIITILFISCCFFLQGQDSTSVIKIDSEPDNIQKYHKGLTLSFGTLITDKLGFDLNGTTLFGKGRVKIGYTVGYTYMHFNDTLNANKILNQQESSAIGALGLGIASRVYTPNGKVYATTTGTYNMTVSDDRFNATNGLSIFFGLGIRLGTRVFLETGVFAQSFITKTNERPSNAAFLVRLSALL